MAGRDAEGGLSTAVVVCPADGAVGLATAVCRGLGTRVGLDPDVSAMAAAAITAPPAAQTETLTPSRPAVALRAVATSECAPWGGSSS
jgi:hypothetical protein